MRWRTLLWLLPAAILLGCPPDDGAAPPPFPGLDGAAPADPAAGLRPTPPPAAPVPAGAPRICLLLPRTGPSRDLGEEMRRGMRLAQDTLAARGSGVAFVEEDTKSTEVGASAAFLRCAASGAQAATGVVHPAAVTAILPVAAAHDTLLVIPELGAAVPSVWNERLIAVAPEAAEMGRVAAEDVALNHKLTRAAVLHPPGTFGERLRDRFTESFQTHGGAVVETIELPENRAAPWAEAAAKAAEGGAQALFVVSPGAPAEAIAATLDSPPLESVMVWFIDWAMFPPVLAQAQKTGAGGRVRWINRRDPFGPFAEAFQAAFQTRPRFEAGSGYSAVLLAAAAIGAADSLEPAAVVVGGRITQVPTAWGPGTIVEHGGMRTVDVGGFGVIEGIPSPTDPNGAWIFGPPR
jgi:ABC-type branched-subunit amino acid transport system substrate-binding protein